MNSSTPTEHRGLQPDSGMGLHIVLIGNPIDGYTPYGPFKTGEDAHRWADDEVDDDWWAAALHAPDENMESVTD